MLCQNSCKNTCTLVLPGYLFKDYKPNYKNFSSADKWVMKLSKTNTDHGGSFFLF